MTIERRIATGRAELRTAGGTKRIAGYGAVFNRETVIGNNFRERIAPGAFQGVIGRSADIVSLFNHSPDQLLGRTTAGTLRVIEDANGLQYEVDVNAEDRAALDIAAKVRRGDVRGSSFGFRVSPDGEQWTPAARAGELPLRTIHRVAELVDIGPVTFPAYNASSAEARTMALKFTTACTDADRVRALGLETARAEQDALRACARLQAPRRSRHYRSDRERVLDLQRACAWR